MIGRAQSVQAIQSVGFQSRLSPLHTYSLGCLCLRESRSNDNELALVLMLPHSPGFYDTHRFCTVYAKGIPSAPSKGRSVSLWPRLRRQRGGLVIPLFDLESLAYGVIEVVL